MLSTLTQKQRISAISQELNATKSAKELGERPFTDDERKRIKMLLAEKETLQAIVDAEQSDNEVCDAIESLATDVSKPNGRKTQPDSLVQSPRIDPVAPQQFKCLGEQLQAIAGVAMTGRDDNRLKWESLAPATGAAVAGVPSDGGYLIQKDFSSELVTRMNEMGQVKSRVRTIQIGPNSDGLRIPAINETSRATGSRFGGVQMYWAAEADAATAKKPQFRIMELELHDLIGLSYVTNRLLQDASAIQSVFSQAFSEEMTFMIEDSIINGTGAGMPIGLLNSGATVSVSKENNQAAATIVFENIQKMFARLWARSRPNAVWLINQDAEPALNSIALAVGAGGVPAYLPPGGLSAIPYGALMGRPVIPVEYCATLGTVGDIILADLSQMLAIEKGGMQADSSIHVRFTTNENTFRFIYRYDAQPVWNSALTPYKGSATQSPFITLATRS